MLNKISFSAIAAMAALSMVSLTACSDEKISPMFRKNPGFRAARRLRLSRSRLLRVDWNFQVALHL